MAQFPILNSHPRGIESNFKMTNAFPSVFKGWLRLKKRSRSLAAQTGWLVISNKIKDRYAYKMNRVAVVILHVGFEVDCPASRVQRDGG
jgi:hypothetical protein